jgi:hypothetical protein
MAFDPDVPVLIACGTIACVEHSWVGLYVVISILLGDEEGQHEPSCEYQPGYTSN